MATDMLGFTTREMRDEQYRRLKSQNEKGVCRYSTHEGNDPHIIYVVAWSPKPLTTAPEPATVAQEAPNENSDSTGPVS